MPYSGFQMPFLEVTARKKFQPYGLAHPCDPLGHASFRCGACKTGYFKVRQLEDEKGWRKLEHPEHCPTCEATIVARLVTGEREKPWWERESEKEYD